MSSDIEFTWEEVEWELPPLPKPDPLLMSEEDWLVKALVEAEVYRLMAQSSLQVLHDLTEKLERERESHERTRAECRRLRVLMLRESRA